LKSEKLIDAHLAEAGVKPEVTPDVCRGAYLVVAVAALVHHRGYDAKVGGVLYADLLAAPPCPASNH
jgi:hypothetical protein